MASAESEGKRFLAHLRPAHAAQERSKTRDLDATENLPDLNSFLSHTGILEADSIAWLFRPSLFWVPERLVPSGWIEHIPFAFWIVDVLRPRTIVELGTHTGVSYSAFCQAVKTLGLSSQCFAIDTWKGDEHSGFYSEEVYLEFSAFHDSRYGAFSRLVRSTFDEALNHFDDGSIDLLHIDGLHTYDAARHDYESWLPKLSPSAVVIFHDINVRERGFCVYKLWTEISSARPNFTFLHGHGLGVLGSKATAQPLRSLFEAAADTEESNAAGSVRSVFARCGHYWAVLNAESESHRRLADQAGEIQRLNQVISTRDDHIERLNRIISGHDDRIEHLNQINSERDDRIALLEHKTTTQYDTLVLGLQKAVMERDSQFLAIKQMMTTNERLIADVNHATLESERVSASLRQSISDRDAELMRSARLLALRDTQIAELQSRLKRLENQQQVSAFEIERGRAQLRDHERTIAAMRSSIASKLTNPFRSVSSYLKRARRAARRAQPSNRERLQAEDIIIRSGLFDGHWYLQSNPDVAIAGFDPLCHYIMYGASEGRDPSPKFSTRGYLAANPDAANSGLNPLLHFALYGAADGAQANPVYPSKDSAPGSEALKNCYREQCEAALDEFLAQDRRLKLPTSDQPDVSVIIVVFNQAPLSFKCLQTLSENLDVRAEVIIVDNASSDRTVELCSRLEGARIVRNEENLHYLHAVNQAAIQSRGNAILLLNNDTTVTSGSLAGAYKLLRDEQDIGAVGGKIVLLDGSLQEAGSVVWSDGSCTGYGRGKQPSDSEFQFRRDVDYCSGAFLLVRRDLFERLDGLDTRFAPAYYEETDLCMRIREAGFRVVYEPRVQVTHFEFGSSRSSEQVVAWHNRNRETFLKRHSDTLQQHHKRPGSPILEARTTRRYAGRILVIDDQLPFPHLGSGFPRAYSMLRAIHEAGWFITFYPLGFPHVVWDEAYRLIPPDVEIMAHQGMVGLESFLRSRTGFYDVILISRPHNMEVFNATAAKISKFLESTKLIYDAEAIFSKRDALQLDTNGTPLSDSEQQERLQRELALAENAAVVLAVNEPEAQVFLNSGITNVVCLGHAVAVEPTLTQFNDRSDVLFVGALSSDQSPNVDSLFWFVHRVMPILDKLLGDSYHLNVVGRNGSKRIGEIANSRVHLVGCVDELTEFYARSRIFIAPTRYAAGLPMKVHGAAAAGLPVVATGLLANQLGWTNGVELLAADRPEDFAEACCKLYSNEQLWQRIRRAALKKAEQDCNPHTFVKTVASVLEDRFLSSFRFALNTNASESNVLQP
jgi:GT2 family glycosyltransferase/glycosyltransferase involved in cell wall biosynthesis